MVAPAPDAPAVLAVFDDGTIRAEIEDHRGEVLPYDVTVHQDGGLSFARLDGKDGPYHVRRRAGLGLLLCDCPDRWRARREGRQCKHRVWATRLLALRPLIDALEHHPTTIPMAKKPVEVAQPPAPAASHNPLPGGRMHKSESIVNLAKALAAAQAELKNPPLDAVNPHYRNRYSSLAGVRDTITPVFSRHGLSIIQSAGSGERGPVITTLLLHVSGEWYESDPLELPASKQDAQGYGSAITYGRRYALQALANVVGDDDDDASQAVAPTKPKAVASGPTATPTAALPGPAFLTSLHAYDERKGYGGALVKTIMAAGKHNGYPDDLTMWTTDEIAWAREQTEAFESQRKAKAS